MPMKMSRIEGGVRLALAFADAFNQHDVAALGRLVSNNFCLDHFSPAPDGSRCRGKAAASQFWTALFHEQPTVQLEVEEVFGLGRHCVLYWQIRQADLDNQPPYRRGVTIFKVQDRLLTEMVSYVKGG